jgi:hypothetical protein
MSSGITFFVDAGLRPEISLDRQSPEDMNWFRGDLLDSGEWLKKKRGSRPCVVEEVCPESNSYGY